LRIELRLVHFRDVDEDIAVGALLQLDLKLVDLGALAADDDARTRGLDDDAQFVAGRSTSIELTPADFSFSFSSCLSL